MVGHPIQNFRRHIIMRQDDGVPLLLEFFDAADNGMNPPAMLQRELAQRTTDFDRLQFFIQLFGGDHRRQGAASLGIGDQEGLLRGQDGRRLGHEVDAAEDDHGQRGPSSLLAERERVADKVREVLDLRDLVVVGEDQGPPLAPQLLDARDQLLGWQRGDLVIVFHRPTGGRGPALGCPEEG